MRLFIFSLVSWYRPDRARPVQFGPLHPRHFIAPLPGQDQQAIERAKGAGQLASAGPYCGKFVVGQHAVARLRGLGLGHRVDRACVNRAAFHCPAEKYRRIGIDGHTACPVAQRDCIDDRLQIGAGYMRHGLVIQRRAQMVGHD